MAIRKFFKGTEGEAAAEFATKHGVEVSEDSGGFVVEYAKGCVIDTYGRDYRPMSDIYATEYVAKFWDEAAGAPRLVAYSDSFELSTRSGSADVDATEDAKGKFEAYHEGKAAAEAINKAFKEADEPHKGARVRVTRGLKRTPKGTEGVVFWVGSGKKYSRSPWASAPMRCGIKDAEGTTHWVNFPSVEVIDYAREGGACEPAAAAPMGMTDVCKGDLAKVLNGPDAGAVGKVIWVGSDRYTGAPRVGVKDSDGEVVWTAAENVSVWEAA